jgi:HPr kinase/phosphorylase
MPTQPSLTIAEFIRLAPAELSLQLVAGGDGTERNFLDSPRLHKLGLALAGFANYLQAGRAQLIGQSEVQYLQQMTPAQRALAVERLEWDKISCIIITTGFDPPGELADAATRTAVPLLSSPLVSSRVINLVVEFLQNELAPVKRLHGVFLTVQGLGVFLEGPSGIGKSECALDLLTRGHKLVADDAVEFRRIGSEKLTGRAPELLRDHLEIRGLGILNVRDLFGIASVSEEHALDLVIRLKRWEEAQEIDRLGLEKQTAEILGVKVPLVILPVSPGRTLSTLVETAARAQLLKRRGVDSSQSFIDRYEQTLNNS